MRLEQKFYPGLFVAIGLFGISLFLIASRSNWSIVPESDFVKGLWFGVSLGFELLGLLLLLKAKVKRAA